MPPSSVPRMRKTLDRVAVGFSALCVVHCLIAPTALVALPVMAAVPFAHQTFHVLMLFLVLPTSLVALFLGCRRHKDQVVLFLGIGGLVLLTVAAIEGPLWLGIDAERAITIAGSTLMVWGHVRNYRMCRSDRCSN